MWSLVKHYKTTYDLIKMVYLDMLTSALTLVDDDNRISNQNTDLQTNELSNRLHSILKQRQKQRNSWQIISVAKEDYLLSFYYFFAEGGRGG